MDRLKFKSMLLLFHLLLEVVQELKLTVLFSFLELQNWFLMQEFGAKSPQSFRVATQYTSNPQQHTIVL